jgi:hypothetical protein
MRRPVAPLVMLLPSLAFALACGGGGARPIAPSPKAAPSASASGEPRASWVVLSPTGLLLERPEADAVGARSEVDPAKAEALRDDDGHYALFQRGEDRGDFVELASLAAAPKGYGCSAPLPALADFAITLWTRKSGLATVTTRKVRTAYADGTAVTLAPGVVLHPRGDGFQARVDPPLVLDVEVPADARGSSFAVTRGFDLDATKSVGSFSDAFRLAGKEWGADVLPDARTVFATTRDAKGTIATLRTQCAQYEVRAGDDVDDTLGLGGLGMMGTGGSWNCQFAPKGARVYFRSGELAGVTRKALQLPKTAEKNRACWVRSLASDGAEREQAGVRSWIEVCVRMSDTKYGDCPM